jgi:DNA polymerase V
MFLDFAGLTTDRETYAAAIRNKVRRIAKIPTCVGIGPTKTIAKLANKVAKRDRNGSGVCDLSYADIDLSDVWGLGRASVAKLNKRGVATVAEFITLPVEEVRELVTVVGARKHAR